MPQREVIGRRIERKDVIEEAENGSRLLEIMTISYGFELGVVSGSDD